MRTADKPSRYSQPSMSTPRGLIRRQPIQHGAQLVNRVVAQPGSRRMRACSGGADHDAQRALAAGLDVARGGLAQDGHVGGQPVRQLTLDAAQTVCRRIDFLAVVHAPASGRARARPRWPPDARRPRHRISCPRCRSRAARRRLKTAGQVVGRRDGVQVPGQQHPRRPAQRGARQHGVAVADDLEAGGLRAQRGLHLVGDARLVPSTRWGCRPAPRSTRSDPHVSPAHTHSAQQTQKLHFHRRVGGFCVCSAKKVT